MMNKFIKSSINEIEELFSEAISEVNSAFPSIYSKSDVAKILINLKDQIKDINEKLTEQIASESTSGDRKEFAKEMMRNIEENLNLIPSQSVQINYESAEFILQYNNAIYLDNVEYDLDSDYIIEKIGEIILKDIKEESPL